MWSHLLSSWKNVCYCKKSAYSAGDPDSIPGSGRSPGEGNGNPLQYSCLGKPHGQRSLVGYSPWGHKESDMTEQFHFPFTFLLQTTSKQTSKLYKLYWKNAINLCPASFCTSRPNLPVIPGISWFPTFAFQSPMMKRTSVFFGVSSRCCPSL